MAGAIEYGSFDVPASSGNFTVSLADTGLTPKFAIFWHGYNNTFGINNSVSNLGMGFTDDVKEFAICNSNIDATSKNAYERIQAVCILMMSDASGTIEASVTAQATCFAAGQINLNVGTAPSSTKKVFYMVVSEESDLQAIVDTVDIPAATGNYSYTGASFTPKLKLGFAISNATTAPIALGNGIICVSGAVSSSKRFAMSGMNKLDKPGKAGSQLKEDASWNFLSKSDGSTNGTCDFVSFNTDGFTENKSVGTVATSTFFILIGGADLENVDISFQNFPTSTGVQSFDPVAFTPNAMFNFHVGNTGTGTVNTVATEYYIGAGDETNQMEFGKGDNDDFLEAFSAMNNDKAIAKYVESGADWSLDAEGGIDSFDSAGINIDFTTVNTAIRFGLLLMEFTLGSGNNPIVANITNTATTAGILTAQGDLESAVTTAPATTGVLTGKGALSGSVNGVATTTTVLTIAPIQIDVVVNGVATTSAILTASGKLIGAVNPALTVSGELSARGKLISLVNGVATVQGILIAKGQLESSITTLPTTSGILTAKGTLAGNSNGSTSTTGILVSSAVAGITNGIATTQGVLTAKGSLSSTVNASATLTGVISSIRPIDSTINNIATTSGTLTASAELVAQINIVVSCSGTLSAKGSLSAQSTSATFTQGIVTAKGDLADLVQAIATVSGTLTSKVFALSSVNGITTTSGVLIGKGLLLSTSSGNATVSASLKGKGALASSINTVATTSGELTGYLKAVSSIDAVATVTGTIIGKMFAVGVVNGVATTSADLTVFVFEGDALGVTTVSGILLAKGSLRASVSSETNLSGNLYQSPLISSYVQGLAIVKGTITGLIELPILRNTSYPRLYKNRRIYYGVQYVDNYYVANYRCKKKRIKY